MKKTEQKNNTIRRGTACRVQNSNGITLVALILTIIIMIILAGVSVQIALGENGILRKSKEAVDLYKDSAKKEQEEMNSMYYTIIERYAGKITQIPEDTTWDSEKVNAVEDGKGNVIPVPKGFSYLEGSETTGFVIKNDTDGNEFVWVPVNKLTGKGINGYAYDIYEWNGSSVINGWDSSPIYAGTDKNYATNGYEAIFKDHVESVGKYGGFYIGRYEAGHTDSEPDIVLIQATSTQKKIYAYSNVHVDTAENKADKMYSQNATSYLCTDEAWDTTLEFVKEFETNAERRNFPVDSTGMGWLKTNYNENSNMETGKPVDSKVSNKLCNIFDMAGNAKEWVASSRNYAYGVRGSEARDSDQNASRVGYLEEENNSVSFRVTLYINYI